MKKRKQTATGEQHETYFFDASQVAAEFGELEPQLPNDFRFLLVVECLFQLEFLLPFENVISRLQN